MLWNTGRRLPPPSATEALRPVLATLGCCFGFPGSWWRVCSPRRDACASLALTVLPRPAGSGAGCWTAAPPAPAGPAKAPAHQHASKLPQARQAPEIDLRDGRRERMGRTQAASASPCVARRARRWIRSGSGAASPFSCFAGDVGFDRVASFVASSTLTFIVVLTASLSSA
ncbi:MAG: hypothetical protein BJ554DRAFT_39 [Olpidium bornovanus]|uniref:Uncharacterized protein n=1 Tax=Olpidium bornovanus TaxID=278681 RepID=A0A8H8DIF0_9FUNG|nr:MAG: hypothetical protein BJ554DRAFT_39 [Olpidium bornovanus]